MNEPSENDAANAADDAPDDEARMRFKSIVEAETRNADLARGFMLVRRDERRWNAMSRQIWQVARLTAIFVIVAILLGLPIGNWLAHRQIEAATGVDRPWNPLNVFEMETLLFAFILPVMVLFVGYALSRILTMLNAAESIAVAAQRIVTPDVTALQNVDSVGSIVEAHMSTLNQGLDNALTRLASVEAMIRQHVEAIELAGDAIDQKAASAVGRVAEERARLMELTESLNAHADSFAAAIAEKANVTIESLQSAENTSLQAEQDFDDRLIRLETAAERAFNSFEALREALRDVDETMRSSAQSIDASSEETRQATERAKSVADAAAESAARNAANIGASAQRAADEAKKAADNAIEAAREHAERTSRSAIEAAGEESARVQDAAAKALEEITKSTSGALSAATEGAAKATKAAEEVSDAARKSGEAAEKASGDVASASERARKSSEEAVKFAESEATRIEERNQALAEARAALEQENARLETLIEEQRKRADRLAEAIATQTDRLSRLAEAQLREQEAAARLAEAQNEMQARADRQAAEKKRAEEAAAQDAAVKAARAAEEAKKTAAAQATLDLGAASRTPPTVLKPVAPDPKTVKTTGNGAARLDELARDIAERRPSKGGPRKTPPLTLGNKGSAKAGDGPRKKHNVSWKEILDAADEGAPLDLGAAAKEAEQKASKERAEAENAIRIIAKLQDFTYELETRLYGDPPPALQERFDKGDRNVFANRLLRLNEADVKRRIRTESGRDRKFENGVHDFLQGFEQLLEDATTSETADEELEEYLSSPLGRVYLLIGATVGYFA
ncbi:hypothetical protein [Hyphococcus sp.]|uniref:hypothetical protein n=1 Tax=Hyphococcus sp. TaxID=2038636 RepID=UPI003CCBAAEC